MATTTIADLFAAYRKTDATDLFAAAYADKNKPHDTDPVYVSFIPADEMGAYLSVSRKSSSHGGGAVLRFRPSVTHKVDMRNRYGAITLCKYSDLVETLAAMRATADKPRKLNLGHAVEFKLCERWGITWEFDNSSHKVKGDITLDGVEYQAKWQSASL